MTLFSDPVGWTRFVPTGLRWRVGVGVAAVGLSVLACGLALWILRRHRGSRRRAALRPAAFAALPGPGLAGGRGREMVRRLGFYARLLDVLGRQGFERPPAETPAAWATALAAADPDRFGEVPEVTDAFYRVRFGGAVPDAAELRRIDAAISRIAGTGVAVGVAAAVARATPGGGGSTA